MLYRARDGADETLEKESRAVRASPAFSQICGPRDRPSAYLRPGGPGGHPLPSIRLKIIDRASHVLEEVFQERGRKESRQSAVVDYRSDIVYRHWKLSRLMAWIVGRKGGRRGGRRNCRKYGFWKARERWKNDRGFPRLEEISFDPIMPVLNAVHALLSSANVVTAIYQVTGRDLHGFKRRSNTFQVLRYSQTRIGRSHLPIRLHLFSESQSSTSTFPTVLPIFVFLARGETSAMTREMNLFFSPE